MALKQIQGSTAPALGLAAAWLPTARTTPPLPAGMTSLRKTRQKPRDMEILWGRRPWAFCPRSEDNIDSCSSSFNNKAASLIHYDSLIAFGAELRPLPLHVSRGNIWHSGIGRCWKRASSLYLYLYAVNRLTEKMQLLSLFAQSLGSFNCNAELLGATNMSLTVSSDTEPDGHCHASKPWRIYSTSRCLKCSRCSKRFQSMPSCWHLLTFWCLLTFSDSLPFSLWRVWIKNPHCVFASFVILEVFCHGLPWACRLQRSHRHCQGLQGLVGSARSP